MSNARRLGDMSMFSHVPIQPQWLMHLPAFQSNNPSIVRGSINMLTSAFFNPKSGTIPNTVEAIASASHLSIEVVKEYYRELTAGWTLDRRKLTFIFEPMADLVNRLDEKFPEALQDMQERAVIAISSPDLVTHELLETQGDPLAKQLGGRTVEVALERIEDTKVRRVLPEGATMTKSMKEHLISRGITEDMHDDMWDMFYSAKRSDRSVSASWEGEWRVWVTNQLRWGKVVAADGSVPAAFKATEIGAKKNEQLPSKVRQVRGFTTTPPNWKALQGEQLENIANNNLAAARNAINRIRSGK